MLKDTYVANGKQVEVEVIDIFLKIRQNLVSIQKKSSHYCSFGSDEFSFSFITNIMGTSQGCK